MSLTETITKIQEATRHTDTFPSLNYSQSTKCWYVNTSVPIFARDDTMMGDTGVLEHKDTPEEAAEAYLQRLKEAPFFYTTIEDKYQTKWYPLRFYKWDEESQEFIIIPTPDGYDSTTTNSDEWLYQSSTIMDLVQMLEDWTGGESPKSSLGTMIQRVMVDRTLLKRYELENIPGWIPKDKECYNVWCVSVGRIQEPKAFFYGWNIQQALKNALKAVKQHHGQPPTVMDDLKEALHTVLPKPGSGTVMIKGGGGNGKRK